MRVSSHVEVQKPMRKLVKYCQVRNPLSLLTKYKIKITLFSTLNDNSHHGTGPYLLQKSLFEDISLVSPSLSELEKLTGLKQD